MTREEKGDMGVFDWFRISLILSNRGILGPLGPQDHIFQLPVLNNVPKMLRKSKDIV